MLKHFNITVTGKVQGVFYRVYTQAKAEKLGLQGFVCNKPNGDVYIEAEGKELHLQELANWCKTGSPKAMVKDVTIIESDMKNFTGFIIKR